jgi:hypothetical protein
MSAQDGRGSRRGRIARGQREGQAMNVEAEEHARQVRLRVERRAGELLREMPKHPPGGSVIACDRSPSEIIRPRHHQKGIVGLANDWPQSPRANLKPL